MVAKAAKRDRKAYQAAYYQRNKKRLNARRTAVRREIQAEANGVKPKAAERLTGAKAAKAIAGWSARNLVVPTPPPPPPAPRRKVPLGGLAGFLSQGRLRPKRQGGRVVDCTAQRQELPNRSCPIGASMRADAQGELEGRRLAADKSSGHAIGIDLGVCDEIGLLENGQLYNSLLSATGGRDGRVFSISIRGDGEIFERIRERKDSPSRATVPGLM